MKISLTRTKGRKRFSCFFADTGADFIWNIIPGRFGVCLTLLSNQS